MTPLKSLVLSALAGVLLAAGALAYLHHRRAEEAAGLRRENGRLRLTTVRRQAEAGPRIAAVTDALPAAAPQAASVGGGADGTGVPQEDFREEGQATPRATLQTFAWACDRGDAAAVARLLHFDAAARVKAAAYRASLPAAAQTQWPTVDDMAATMLVSANMNSRFPAARVLALATEERVGPERVKLRLPGTPKDGTEYQKIGDAWRYVITEAMVDRYLAEVAARRAR